MEVTLLRYDRHDGTGVKGSTLGLWLVNGVQLGVYALEDMVRDPGATKVYGETAIPALRYRLALRRFGDFHTRYAARFEWHKGMIQVMDVPTHSDILIHCGNTIEHTKGCPITGSAFHRGVGGHFEVSGSTTAYEKLYKRIADVLIQGRPAWLNVMNAFPAKEAP